jgi:hypothetical protein
MNHAAPSTSKEKKTPAPREPQRGYGEPVYALGTINSREVEAVETCRLVLQGYENNDYWLPEELVERIRDSV